MDAEKKRLEECRTGAVAWKKWGPYLSERQWGTVREDYSETGNAWDYFPHDQARSRAYRWGEDGLAGISDDQQWLCFALALWNGRDPILKERLFGLTNSEGNHGEDVKEYYYYLDSTPTHSYLKFLYKYPQAAYPYLDLITRNRSRSRNESEYELIDTGIFEGDRYFDVFVEYAKAGAEDLLIQISAFNRGPETATLHLLPTLWFRNTWSWSEGAERPRLEMLEGDAHAARAIHPDLGQMILRCESPAGNEAVGWYFTENETDTARLFQKPSVSPYVKDAFHERVIGRRLDAVNPTKTGTKTAAHQVLSIPPGRSATMRLRLSRKPEGGFEDFDKLMQLRRTESDAFYQSVTPSDATEDERNVFRQALAGMLWSKQFFLYDVIEWQRRGSGLPVADPPRAHKRNASWFHLSCRDIISMPDKWEYPWFAAWDLAFHCVPLSHVDPDFAKAQLELILGERYLHPNGQVPAYEWNFGDVNPPVHAWACWLVYLEEKQRHGKGDLVFLKRCFQKLLMNFTWWVNRKDFAGQNVFEGGFLGLDNIGVFDRSKPLPTGGTLEQADGTAWMAFFCQMMLQISSELAVEDDATFEDLACKFYEHFLWIAASMDRPGNLKDELWDEEDGFFYDVLRLPNGSGTRLKVRSMVGLLPLCATTVLEATAFERLPRLRQRIDWFVANKPELTRDIRSFRIAGKNGRRMLGICDETKLRRILHRMLDEQEFLSPFGIRALSRFHKDQPYTFTVDRDVYRVDYEPGESSTGLFGGNSNWRGPIWFPVNVLLVRALLFQQHFYGDDFRVECPTGSGHLMTLGEIARELSHRLQQLFLRDGHGRRPVYGPVEKFQTDPHWQDLILFFEYFHGDTGLGLGASHQTGWTGVVAKLIELFPGDEAPATTGLVTKEK